MLDEQKSLHDGALQAMGNGFPIVLAAYGEKGNAFRNPKALSSSELRAHFLRKKYNVAARLGEEVVAGLRLMVTDADSEPAMAFIREHKLQSSAVVHTSR